MRRWLAKQREKRERDHCGESAPSTVLARYLKSVYEQVEGILLPKYIRGVPFTFDRVLTRRCVCVPVCTGWPSPWPPTSPLVPRDARWCSGGGPYKTKKKKRENVGQSGLGPPPTYLFPLPAPTPRDSLFSTELLHVYTIQQTWPCLRVGSCCCWMELGDFIRRRWRFFFFYNPKDEFPFSFPFFFPLLGSDGGGREREMPNGNRRRCAVKMLDEDGYRSGR